MQGPRGDSVLAAESALGCCRGPWGGLGHWPCLSALAWTLDQVLGEGVLSLRRRDDGVVVGGLRCGVVGGGCGAALVSQPLSCINLS
jgi:hypothetical protein